MRRDIQEVARDLYDYLQDGTIVGLSVGWNEDKTALEVYSKKEDRLKLDLPSFYEGYLLHWFDKDLAADLDPHQFL